MGEKMKQDGGKSVDVRNKRGGGTKIDLEIKCVMGGGGGGQKEHESEIRSQCLKKMRQSV